MRPSRATDSIDRLSGIAVIDLTYGYREPMAPPAMQPFPYLASVIIAPMRIPPKLPGLKWLTVIVGLWAVVWISLEGSLWQIILLAVSLVLLAAGYLMQRLLGGRGLTQGRWLLFCGALGAAMGLASAVLALLLMAIKTGLHGHGPEFTAAEIEWIVGQIPLWTMTGIIAALGLGIMALAFQRR